MDLSLMPESVSTPCEHSIAIASMKAMKIYSHIIGLIYMSHRACFKCEQGF